MAIYLGGIPLITEKVSGLPRVEIDQWIEDAFWNPQTMGEAMLMEWLLLKHFCPKEADAIIKPLKEGIKISDGDDLDITQYSDAVLFCVAGADIEHGTRPDGRLHSVTPVIKLGNEIHDCFGVLSIDKFRATIAELGHTVVRAVPFESKKSVAQ